MASQSTRLLTRGLLAAVVSLWVLALALASPGSVGAASVAASAVSAGPRPGQAAGAVRAVAAAPAGAVAARTAQDVEVVQTTADMSQRLQRLPDLKFTTKRPRHLPMIHVDDTRRYQRVHGVGAAMTDTSAWLIYDQLSPTDRATVMQNLFGLNGINLNFTLLPIGATDFTMNGQPYTYDDQPQGQVDPLLQHFSIAHDTSYVIPALRQMLSINPQTEIFAVPWSPPAWMKANQALHNLGNGGLLLPSAYQPLADYFVRFIESYADQGVPIAAIAPENEPHSPASFPGMELPEPIEAQWITQYLRPTLTRAHLNPRIYAGDTAWKNPGYALALLNSPARSAINGIAWHCYNGLPYVIGAAHGEAPSLDHVVSECSPGISPYPVPEVLIGSMRNWARTVTLWNLALDPAGGPVQPPNAGCKGCTGLVTINEQDHQVTYNLPYYQLGQLGRFVQPGAWRIDTEHFVTYYHTSAGANGATAGIDDVAFLNPDGSRVVLAYNNSTVPIKFALAWRGNYFTYTLPAGATTTFAWGRSPAAGQAAVAVHAQSDHPYVFWQGPTGYLQEAWFDGLRWTGPVSLTSWGKTASSPSSAIGDDYHQYVFWEGTNGHIYEAWYQHSGWAGPKDMTAAEHWGTATAAPAVAVNPRNDSQYVFWRGTDGRIHQAWWTGRWHGPVATDWESATAPSVAVSDVGHQYVFWQAKNGDVMEAWYGHHWNGPVDMTTTSHWPRTTAAPAVAVNPDSDHQYVFWRDTKGNLVQAFTGASGWRGPLNLTARYGVGQTLSAPAAAVANDNSQFLFWRSTAGNIREGVFHGGWQVIDLNWR